MERIEKIRKGEVPEGYKETKVGIIPEDWDSYKLSKLGFFKNGINKDKEDFGHGIPLIGLNDVFAKKVLCDGEPFESLVNCSKNEINNYDLKEGDVLFVRSSVKPEGVGLTSIIDTDIENTVYSGFIIRYRVTKKLIKNFRKYAFDGFYFRKNILRKSTISVNTNVSQDILNSLEIISPSDPEQEKIAEILSTWDKAIDLKEKLIEEKKEFKRGLIQRLLVGKLRFKEHVKSPNLQEVKRYGILPEEWGVKKASSIFSNISKKNNGNEQLLSATQNNGVIPRDMLDGDVMSPSGDTNSYKLVEEGDFVISLRSFQGGLEYSCYRGMVSPAYTVLKNKIPICKDFYRHLFKSKLFIDRLASSVIGIRDGKQISYEDFSFMVLPYPELKEQEKIAFMLNDIDRNIELLKLELNQLQDQKRGLMQLLLTGIVRVEVD